MSHFFELIFDLLFELIEFSEPYLLITTIFFIPFTIMVTSLPKRIFQYEFMQHLLPTLFTKYEGKKAQLERINAMTQNAMIVILLIDLLTLGQFFFGGNEIETHHEAGTHSIETAEHPSEHGAETER
ncbi:MAG: hypothetical protein PHD53_09435 [Methylococcales bacterium]|nr:hypothetical protein [Methylococcales bacterium]